MGFLCGSVGKESSCNVGNLSSIPGLRRSPGEGKGYSLQYSGLENSMDYPVHGVTKSRKQLSDFHFHFQRGQSILKNDQLRTQIFWHNGITNVCPKFFNLLQRYNLAGNSLLYAKLWYVYLIYILMIHSI